MRSCRKPRLFAQLDAPVCSLAPALLASWFGVGAGKGTWVAPDGLVHRGNGSWVDPYGLFHCGNVHWVEAARHHSLWKRELGGPRWHFHLGKWNLGEPRWCFLLWKVGSGWTRVAPTTLEMGDGPTQGLFPCFSSNCPTNRSKPSKMVYGWGGQPGM